MRKTVFVLTLIILTAVNCHKDDTRPPITGKWFMISENYKLYQENDLVTNRDYQLTGTGYYEFLANDSLKSEDDYGNQIFTTYSYNPINSKLKTEYDEFTVVKLTSSQLTLQKAYSYFVSDDSLTHYKSVQEMYFKK